MCKVRGKPFHPPYTYANRRAGRMSVLLAGSPGRSWDMRRTRKFMWDAEGTQPPSVPASQCLGENDQNKVNSVLLPTSKNPSQKY